MRKCKSNVTLILVLNSNINSELYDNIMEYEIVNEHYIDDELNEHMPLIPEKTKNVNNDRASKRPRTTTSKIWDHFTRIGIVDGK